MTYGLSNRHCSGKRSGSAEKKCPCLLALGSEFNAYKQSEKQRRKPNQTSTANSLVKGHRLLPTAHWRWGQTDRGYSLASQISLPDEFLATEKFCENGCE